MSLKRKEELKKLIEAKKAEISEAKKNADKFNAMQLALKLVLNGSYGALAAKHFVMFCNGVAGTITAHGRDLIRNMNDVNEDYWYNDFHNDHELHKAVAIHSKVLDFIEFSDLDKNDIINNKDKYQEIVDSLDLSNLVIPKIEPLDSTWVNSDNRRPLAEPTEDQIYVNGEAVRKVPVSIYADTDSCFVGYKPAIEAYKWKHDPQDLVLFAAKFRTEPYFKQKLEDYANRFKVKNVEDFELEQVSKSIIYLAKKMYVKNVTWDEGAFSLPETNIQAKGIDLVRSSSPVFTRQKVYAVLKYFFENPTSYTDRGLVKFIREMKELFKLAPVEDICVSSSCSNYATKVLDDQTNLRFVTGAHYAVKAAGFHNYLLNQNPIMKRKYNSIKSGNKVKMYHTTSNINDRFAFVAGQFPKEIAFKYAPIDYDKQFEVAILKLINRMTDALGLSELTPKLTYTMSIF